MFRSGRRPHVPQEDEAGLFAASSALVRTRSPVSSRPVRPVSRPVYGLEAVPDQEIDDVPDEVDGAAAVAPGIVMVASGTQPAALVLPPAAELGRRIAAGSHGLEIDDERMSRDHAVVRVGAWRLADHGSRQPQRHVRGRRADLGRGAAAGDVDPPARPHRVRPARRRPRPPGAGRRRRWSAPSSRERTIRSGATPRGDTLLVHGEPGSGKELAARVYHEAGPRRAGPFVAVNCAAIPEGVAERLLFGAKKSAFAGAIEAIGHFQMARGGTLFLDDIADLDPAVQARLLRVLEAREVLPVGATAGTPIDIGIVAASHRELRAAVAERRFRDDLYYRLARATVHLPPLRDRKVDVARLVQREVAATGRRARAAREAHRGVLPAAVAGQRARAARRGPPRRHRARRAAGRDVVRVEDLDPTAGVPAGTPTGETAVERRTLALDELDRDAVTAALGRANGVISVAARSLGLHRTQLYRLMDKLGIPHEDT